MQLSASELILNADNSIYHLNLLPEDLAKTVIVVGDQNRVPLVSKYFDTIDLKKGKREFITHTGTLNGTRISVVSTGIGTDNIDIVMNELDALVNIDFETRTIKEDKISLDIVRIGTSGGIQPNIETDSFLLSEYAIGFDNVLHFYESEHIQHPEMQLAFIDHAVWSVFKSIPYVVESDLQLTEKLRSDSVILGFTGTNVGFYGPQGRRLRLLLEDNDLNSKLSSFEYNGMRITNLEMETSAIYGLAKLMGHRAASLNCILANRSTGQFSKDPVKTIDSLIKYTLEKLTAY
ncbi:nucleoside phosphorylase [uncultured Eudoraea sp.]|uniref:nucleoside phosphorylase n=1 Tax=uncultured Eudoraea sp. TaxID=1035614 RepID=UPI002626FBFC|nr:nucleoside phosphorylase [uncultured Eudoraea sp.]